jgi:high-affinity K+ transport system ATPase subunit B
MTRIQLKGMTTRELVEFARLAHLNLMKPDGDLILELAERLDDVYPFNSDEQPQNVFNDFEKETML